MPGSDHSVRISVTEGRAKTKNLRRDPRASLHVTRDDFFAYVVLDGEAALSPVAQTVDDPVVEELVEMYRLAQGEHPDWDEYRQVDGVRPPGGAHPVGHQRLRHVGRLMRRRGPRHEIADVPSAQPSPLATLVAVTGHGDRVGLRPRPLHRLEQHLGRLGPGNRRSHRR